MSNVRCAGCGEFMDLDDDGYCETCRDIRDDENMLNTKPEEKQ